MFHINTIAAIQRSYVFLEGLYHQLLHSSFFYVRQYLRPLFSTQVLSVVNDSNEILDDQMVSEDFTGIRNESSSFARECIVDADDEDLADISNDLV